MDLEEKEAQEEAKIKGKPFLAKHFKKHKRRSKKRCWYCGGSGHFKRYCPKLQCFKCHRLGHMKADCFMRKIDYLLSELEKMYKRKEKRRISKASKQRNKHQMKEIYKLRAEQSEFIEDMGKWKLKWQNEIIGCYLGPDTLKPLKEFQQNSFDWKVVEVELKKPKKITRIPLLDGFINDCGCEEEFMLRKREFITHINTMHGGLAPPHTLINKPYWIDYIAFFSEEIELLYCRSNADLT